jgi:hypothetical protein
VPFVSSTSRPAAWLLDGIALPLAVWNGVLSSVVLIGLAILRGSVRNS